ncbi:hypothetical protein [Streptomyces sp. PA5.6]|uniref:hypothetical protein n=1 Tax=Streptomyces sp. PA5.6 TaxID=3035651 RepID=UPI003904D41B
MYFPVGDSCDRPPVQTISLVMEDDELLPLLTLSEAQDVVAVLAALVARPAGGRGGGGAVAVEARRPRAVAGLKQSGRTTPGCGRVAPLP